VGEWERRRASFWAYRVGDQARPYGYAMANPRRRGTWDALVLGAQTDNDMTLAERVSFDEARAVIERHAAEHVRPA